MVHIFSLSSPCPLDGKWAKHSITTGCYWPPVTVSLLMVNTLKTETLATMLLNSLHCTCSSPYMVISCLHWHVVHVWPVLINRQAGECFRSHFELLGKTPGTEWHTDQCAVRPKKGQACSASRLPPEASWPRIISCWKFAFWGSWKVADTSSYIEDRSFITVFSLSSPNCFLPPLSLPSFQISQILVFPFICCCWLWDNTQIPYKW